MDDELYNFCTPDLTLIIKVKKKLPTEQMIKKEVYNDGHPSIYMREIGSIDYSNTGFCLEPVDKSDTQFWHYKRRLEVMVFSS